MWEEREIGGGGISASERVGYSRTGQRPPRPHITQIPNFSISPMSRLWCRPDTQWWGAGPGQMEDWGHDTSRVGERQPGDGLQHPLLCFNVEINILIMLCARCVLWMQPGLTLGPLPLWMMDEPGPSQDRVCSPAKASLPPPPLLLPWPAPGTDINCQALIHFTGSNIQRDFYLGGFLFIHDFFCVDNNNNGPLSCRDLLRAPDPGYENYCPRMKPGASNEN